jgi:ABC-type arginine transport system permease subunit
MPNVNPIVAALVALAIQFGAYAAVVFTDWLKVFPRGFVEAGAAIGMSNAQIRRRIFIPILLAQATPALGNLALVMIKISALASLIGLEELSRRTQIVSGSTRDPMLCYSVAAAMYLAITILASALQGRIEKQIRGRG